MNIGGVEKSFLCLLSLINPQNYEVHVGLLSLKGGFMNSIPSWVHIHHIDCYEKFHAIVHDPPKSYIKDMLSHKQWKDAFVHTLLYMHYKIIGTRSLLYRYFMRNEPVMPGTFDLAVAYAGPSQHIDYYICRKVNARVKCGWIHFDISKFGIDHGMTKRLYKTYTRIFCVSQTAKEVFDKAFPTLKEKTEVFYNVVNPSLIRCQANNGISFSDTYCGKRILTVGRISKEKGQLEAIEAFAILLKKGLNAKWYFIGDGGTYVSNCMTKVKELGIEEAVTFLGTKINPYPFMKDCDIYVQPSRHEGYCITLAEARVFGMPIVATDFTGAREQLSNRPNAYVTAMEPQSIANGILKASETTSIGYTTMNHNIESTNINKFTELCK